jgi:hypothetical protein
VIYLYFVALRGQLAGNDRLGPLLLANALLFISESARGLFDSSLANYCHTLATVSIMGSTSTIYIVFCFVNPFLVNSPNITQIIVSYFMAVCCLFMCD